MRYLQARVTPILSGILAVGLSGSASAKPTSEQAEEQIELVAIEIHMPDGRVIKKLEPRYPSRSRVLISTGKLPAFNKGVEGSVGTGSETGADDAIAGTSDENASQSTEPSSAEPMSDDESVASVESIDSDETGVVKTFKKSS